MIGEHHGVRPDEDGEFLPLAAYLRRFQADVVGAQRAVDLFGAQPRADKFGGVHGEDLFAHRLAQARLGVAQSGRVAQHSEGFVRALAERGQVRRA